MPSAKLELKLISELAPGELGRVVETLGVRVAPARNPISFFGSFSVAGWL